MKSPFFRFATVLVAMTMLNALMGCAGYQLGSTKPQVYAGLDTLHIPPFKNNTLEPRLSSLVTNAVLKKIHVDGSYRVGNRSNCDAVLVGVIKDIRKRQLRAVRLDTLRSRELNVAILIEWHLEDPETGARLGNIPRSESGKKKPDGEMIRARRGSVTGSTIQVIDGSLQVSERSALSMAAENAAMRLVSQLSDGW